MCGESSKRFATKNAFSCLLKGDLRGNLRAVGRSIDDDDVVCRSVERSAAEEQGGVCKIGGCILRPEHHFICPILSPYWWSHELFHHLFYSHAHPAEYTAAAVVKSCFFSPPTEKISSTRRGRNEGPGPREGSLLHFSVIV